jgi:SAM-dependent methyltransferase
MTPPLPRLVKKLLRTVANHDPDYYDMHDDPDEAWFAKLYVERICRHAEAAGLTPPVSVLDAGCQAGRLAVPLGERGFSITGIDTSGFALRRARLHARSSGVRARFVKGDLLKVLTGTRERFDIVLCAEVVYLSPRYRDMIRVLADAVKPGGLLCISHRPKMYYLLESLRHGNPEAVRMVLTSGEGQFKGPFPERGYYNWQTDGELRELYRGLGFDAVSVYPIDQTSWLSGVPPSQLADRARQFWLDAELSLQSDEHGPCARYALVIASKGRADAA